MPRIAHWRSCVFPSLGAAVLALILVSPAVLPAQQWPPEIKMSPEVKERVDRLWPKLGLG